MVDDCLLFEGMMELRGQNGLLEGSCVETCGMPSSHSAHFLRVSLMQNKHVEQLPKSRSDLKRVIAGQVIVQIGYGKIKVQKDREIERERVLFESAKSWSKALPSLSELAPPPSLIWVLRPSQWVGSFCPILTVNWHESTGLRRS